MTEQIPINPGAHAVQSSPSAVQAGPPAVKPKPTWLVLTVAGGVLAAIFVFLAIFAKDRPDTQIPTAPPAIEDVSLTKCGGDQGRAEAEVSVSNRGTQPHYYAVTVEFYDSSGREIASGVVLVNDVQPGQSVTDTLTERTDATGDVVSRCRVTHVTRA